MTRTVSHFDWQVLRALARAGGPALGRDLRVTPSTRTRDGAFLDELVRAGLIEAVGDPDPERPLSEWSKPVPVQLRTWYRLTDRGAHAAEYGEYEYDFDAARKAREGGAP